jgi:hypothetical protein
MERVGGATGGEPAFTALPLGCPPRRYKDRRKPQVGFLRLLP